MAFFWSCQRSEECVYSEEDRTLFEDVNGTGLTLEAHKDYLSKPYMGYGFYEIDFGMDFNVESSLMGVEQATENTHKVWEMLAPGSVQDDDNFKKDDLKIFTLTVREDKKPRDEKLIGLIGNDTAHISLVITYPKNDLTCKKEAHRMLHSVTVDWSLFHESGALGHF